MNGIVSFSQYVELQCVTIYDEEGPPIKLQVTITHNEVVGIGFSESMDLIEACHEAMKSFWKAKGCKDCG